MLLKSILFTAACLVAWAQPRGSGVISGIVVQKSTGEPVRKAIVTLTWHGNPQSWATAMTDAAGRFRFDSLPAGKYQLRAFRDGMGAAVYGAENMAELGRFLSLTDGETRSDLALYMIRPNSISGKVVDMDGDPIVRANVMVFREGYPRGSRELLQRGGAQTNDRGEYRITNLEPGRYYIAAGQNAPPVFTPDSRREVFLRQFYGGTTDWRRATPLTVGSGERVSGIDFRLTVAHALHMRGRVTGVPDISAQAGAPPQNLEIGLTAIGEGLMRGRMGMGAFAPEYRFEFHDIAPGRYLLAASLRVGQKTYWASQNLDLIEDPGEIMLALAPATDLKGRVRVEGEGAEQFKNFQVTLVRGDVRGVHGDISSQTGPEGRFTLEQVPPGVWDIGVTPIPRGGYLKSMRLGKQDVLTEEMEIGPGTDAPLDIVVSTRGGVVEGEVDSEGAAQERAAILLAPAGRYQRVMSFYATTISGEGGKFQFSGIIPGPYKIFAFEQIPPGTVRDPGLVARLGELGQAIEVAEGARVKVRPKLIPAGKLPEALK